MRPVDKGGQGTYAPVVDMSSQANLDASLKNITVTFDGKASPKAKKLWGKNNPNAWQVLYALYNLIFWDGQPPAKKQKGGPPSSQDVNSVKATLVNKLATIYGTASGPLEDQLGRFCSFCEHYYQSGLAVEHIVPKAPFPLFYIAWNNFLLACPVCNSNKLSKPPRDDALFTPAPANEVGYYTVIHDNYLWPQWFTKVYRNTKPVLEFYVQNNWWEVTYPVADQTELKTADKATRTIYADVYSNAGTTGEWWIDVPVRVRVNPTDARSTNMVNSLVNLNKPSSNKKKPGGEADIRLWSRTEHWFKVLEALQDVKAATDATTFNALWKMMMKSVQQPGLYSVWVTVIDLLGPGGSWVVPGSAQSVMDKFLAEIVDQAYFPGTDTADTP